ncbi:WD40 repeat domain-containing protein [Streptomyces sp. NPDC060049]|uniref:WD40 repeat domain-containing protein n=1 Tax=Streptomyces sp. NPDC060049 TaxID=3347046 RepID=UPI003684B70D
MTFPATGTSRPPLRGHSDQVSAVAFSPDGATLATASFDATARLWDGPVCPLRPH